MIKDGILSADISETDNGYVVVYTENTEKCRMMKTGIMCNGNVLYYDTDTSDGINILPLTFGSGNYTIILYKCMEGNNYSEKNEVSSKIKEETPRDSLNRTGSSL